MVEPKFKARQFVLESLHFKINSLNYFLMLMNFRLFLEIYCIWESARNCITADLLQTGQICETRMGNEHFQYQKPHLCPLSVTTTN